MCGFLTPQFNPNEVKSLPYQKNAVRHSQKSVCFLVLVVLEVESLREGMLQSSFFPKRPIAALSLAFLRF